MAEHEIAPIDLVVVNLYPFRQTVASGAAPEDCIENIDIGGPALIRAAAKNTSLRHRGHRSRRLRARCWTSWRPTTARPRLALRQRLAAAAYAHTAAYDAAIAHWMAGQRGETFPAQMSVAARRAEILRYGENPHQTAAFYLADGGPIEPRPGVATARQLQGKALSYNNLNDTDAAFELAAEFDHTAVAIIKHANPCGVALGATQVEAYLKALSSDPVSAFGGIVALNRPLEADTAAEIAKLFVEVIIAPEVSDDAARMLARKENLRLLVTGAMPDPAAGGMTMKALAGGLLLQIHGGAWITGSRTNQALPLMHRLASEGWVCVSVDYRLSPHATFPEHLIDCKRGLAWIHENIAEHGGNPNFVVVTGGSAGGHLATLLALTANDPEYQPGFEGVDTTVQGCVSFYGVYDFADRHGDVPHPGLSSLMERSVMKAALQEDPEGYDRASPVTRIHPDAPPIFVIHGDKDSLAPVAGARRFVAELRKVSKAPVVYAEIPGAQHAFEMFPSRRTNTVVAGVTHFVKRLHSDFQARQEQTDQTDQTGEA